MDLKVGSIKTNVEAREEIRRRGNLSGGGGGSNGGGKNRGGGGNDGGDNFKNPPFEPRDEKSVADKSRIVMWCLLIVVMMTFGSLISLYIVIATDGALEWKPFNLPFQIWISTALILASSIAYHISNTKLQNNQQSEAKKWLLATTVLGATFISSQILLWLNLVGQGVYVSSNPYAGLFFILTIVHAFHVLVGIAALGYIVLRSWNKTADFAELAHRQAYSRVIGWYWHFMDGLWILLILLLGFWK